jgi:hypothetical protein
MVLIAELASFDATKRRDAISHLFTARATHLAPRELPPPPADWSRPYRALASELESDLDPGVKPPSYWNRCRRHARLEFGVEAGVEGEGHGGAPAPRGMFRDINSMPSSHQLPGPYTSELLHSVPWIEARVSPAGGIRGPVS